MIYSYEQFINLVTFFNDMNRIDKKQERKENRHFLQTGLSKRFSEELEFY